MAADPARVWACLLGSKDCCQADREVAAEIVRCLPQAAAMARAGRGFGRRVVTYAAGARGIRQFLDVGPGLPVAGAAHEVAQSVTPGSRVVYADSDAVVLSHARALLTARRGSPPCGYISGDIRDPAALLAGAGRELDLARPVAVLLLSILHHVPDADHPERLVAELAAGLAPGSLVAVSHLTADYAPGPVAAAAEAWNARLPGGLYPRSRDQILGLLGGVKPCWPGLVPVTRWRPAFAEAPGGPCDLCGVLGIVPGGQGQRPPARKAGAR